MDKGKYKRTYRLIHIIQEIKTSPCQTIPLLLKSLKISHAQFFKDKDALSQLGFEFYYDRKKSRFIITKDAYLPVENLSISERISLIMAVRQLSAAGDYLLTYEGLNAARKLSADLPAPLRENAATLFDDLVLKEGFGCDRKVMERLQAAIMETRRIMLAYQAPGEQDSSQHEIDPYHLFFKRRALYVEGYSATEKAILMFRLNRIKKVSFTAMHFQPVDNYDFGKRHRNAFSVFPGEKTQRVIIRFSQKARPFIEESLWHHSQVIKKEKNGFILFQADVAEPREVLWWALQWGADAEILEPLWLREEAKKTVERMTKKYER